MKNTVTNIFGLILWGLVVYELIFTDYSIYEIVSLIVIGGVLFLFSNRALKQLLKSIVSKKGSDIVRSATLDPDRDKPDGRG